MGCAGIVINAGPDSDLSVGQAVFGLGRSNVGTFSRDHCHLFAPMLADYDFNKAAAMAVPLAIAHVAILQNAGLQKGETVLIENGADLYGHTAIQLAQHLGAIVAATVENDDERQALVYTYKIPAEMIFLNKDVARISSTHLQWPTKTDVLISSSSKRFPASEMKAPFGRNIHIDMNGGSFSPAYLPRYKSVSLIRLNISDIIVHRPGHIRSTLEAIWFLPSGRCIHPAASIQVHTLLQISKAFCEVRAARTFSRTRPTSLPEGFGGIGPTIYRWMASKGAKNLIILSCSGPYSFLAEALFEELYAQNDSVFETMTYKEWTTAISPRIQGTLNLYALLPSTMEFFFLLSSINGILGARFQANYTASNTFLDALAYIHYDQRIVSIDMGWYATTLASNDFLNGRFDALGCVYQDPDDQLLGLLDYYCNPERELRKENCQTMLGVAPPSYARAHGKAHPELLERALWRVMSALDTSSNLLELIGVYQRKTPPLSSLIASVESDTEAAELICNSITQKLAFQPGIEEEIIKEKPVHVAGVGSLIAVELRTWFKKEVGINVSVFEIMGNRSLQGLCEKAVERRQAVKPIALLLDIDDLSYLNMSSFIRCGNYLN